jgi:adenylate cyclase
VRLGGSTLRPFGASDGGYAAADDGGYQLLLDFEAGPHAFPTFPLSSLLEGGVPAGTIRDRVVILGTSAPSVKDFFTTPHSVATGSARISGLELHAHAVDQLLRTALDGARPIAHLPDSVEALAILAMSLLGVVLGSWIRSPFWLASLGPAIPVAALAAAAGLMRVGWWVPVVPGTLACVLSGGISVTRVAWRERIEKAQLMQIFGRNVGPQVAERLWAERRSFLEGGRPRPQLATVSVLMADLAGFSAAAGRLEPMVMMAWLDRCMGMAARVADRHGGVVDDYAGDGLKVNFGVPVPRGGEEEVVADARAAVHCALQMGSEFALLNRELALEGLPPASLRIGIATGPALVGCLGSRDRLKYTSVGEPVITAARLESLEREEFADGAEESPIRILVAESTLRMLEAGTSVENWGTYVLKGKCEPVSVFRVIAEPAEDPSDAQTVLATSVRLAPGRDAGRGNAGESARETSKETDKENGE